MFASYYQAFISIKQNMKYAKVAYQLLVLHMTLWGSFHLTF